MSHLLAPAWIARIRSVRAGATEDFLRGRPLGEAIACALVLLCVVMTSLRSLRLRTRIDVFQIGFCLKSLMDLSDILARRGLIPTEGIRVVT